jgi:hypothetical protein
MTVRHIKYGAKAEDVAAFSAAFVDTVGRLLGDERWFEGGGWGKGFRIWTV